MSESTQEIDVTVVIVNWNTRGILRDCLESIYAQTEDILFEVVVVDNGSTDGSATMVQAEFPQAILVANSKNLGFAAANNQGIEISKGRYVLLLNSDTVVLDGAIQKTVAYADAHPEVGVLGCRAMFPDGRRQNTCFRFPSVGLEVWSALLFFRKWKPFWRPLLYPERYLTFDFDVEHDVDVVAGCFFLVRRQVVEQVGRLDEDFFMYGEEAEWCHRIARGGWRVRYYPGASITHLYGASEKQVDVPVRLRKRAAILLFLQKTRGPIHAWMANATMFVGVLLRFPFWVLASMVPVLQGNPSGIKKPLMDAIAILKYHLCGLFHRVWAPTFFR